MANEWLFPAETTEDSQDYPRNEELFVFGYHCKLFRDDEQAKLVDSGAYMIPWMGDDSLKIDRYDGRGHLFDLRPYDADNMKGLPAPVLSEDEQHVEKLCDEERYLELHTNLAEKTMYEEEEWKRYYESLAEGYKAVEFSYEGRGQAQAYTEPVPEVPKENPDEAKYVPPTELQVPPGTDIPSTVKENAVIEKTAKFVAEHGVQMEIVLKTKQANNPQFLFMHFENILHPYYKHLVKMIKSKKYIPKSPVKEDSHNDSWEGDDGGHGYLHPALTTNRASPVPQEPYKPIQMPKVSIHETSYGQLLQSFSKVNKELEEKKREREVKMKQSVKSEPQESSLPACVAQPAYPTSVPPPPGIEPVQLPKGSDSPQVKQEPQDEVEGDVARSTSPPAQIVPPPPDVQPIIDRMAMYVAKNGEEFAIVVKTKNDTRFQFLESWHTHYPYYNFKRHLFGEEIERERKEKEAEEKKKEQEKAEVLAKGVKFKLKKASKEQDPSTLEKKPVFEYDESDENDDSDSARDMRKPKSNSASGTSTPVRDQESDSKSSEQLERKLAEQRLKDRLAMSAREKLSQVDKERQIKAERKKKAALFINLLKSKNPPEQDEACGQPSLVSSGTNTPVGQDEEDTSNHKSKHKSRDRRSRSRDRSSRSRRSRSRSKSRSKKKRRKRSPTPPSAYNVTRRSPLRFPPPPPPRHLDLRTRYSRSPSKGRSSKHRSRSRSKERSSRRRSRSKSPPRSKSKKKKRSRSPKSKKDHKKSSKKKKKRSRSRSKEKVSGPEKASHEDEVQIVIEVTTPDTADPRVASPAGLEEDTREALEEGETRDSSPEPGQITDTDTPDKESPSRTPRGPPDIESEENQGSPEHSPHRRKRSRSVSSSSSKSLSPRLRSRSRSFTPTNKGSKSQSRSRSRSSSRGISPQLESEIASQRSRSVSREVTPVKAEEETMEVASPSSTAEINGTEEVEQTLPQSNVSSYMLDRVRAIIKASKEAMKQEDSILIDDDT